MLKFGLTKRFERVDGERGICVNEKRACGERGDCAEIWLNEAV